MRHRSFSTALVLGLSARSSLPALLMAMLIAGGAHAQTNRCVGRDGKTTYTDQPCPSATEQQPVSIVDNASDSSEVRRRIATGAKSAPEQMEGGAAATLSPGEANDPQSLARTCPAKKRDYEIAVSTVKKDLLTMDRQYALAARACQPGFERLPEHVRFAIDARLAAKQQQRDARTRAAPAVPGR